MADAADLLDKRHGRINDDAKSSLPRNPFQLYTQEQAQAYATGRGTTYPPLLYAAILDYHSKGDGDFKRLLDVGSGPGKATRYVEAVPRSHDTELITSSVIWPKVSAR